MNHLAQIQKEFVKESRKWDDLSIEEQKAYLQRHPKSKRRVTAKPGQSVRPEQSKQREKPATEQPKTRTRKTKKSFPAEEIKQSLKYLNLGGYDKDDAEIETDQKGKPTRVTTAFRDLGTWHSRPFEEDDDHPNWDPESYKKYSKMFEDWANSQSWFDPQTMTTRVSDGEKAWAYFEVALKNQKAIKNNTRHAKLNLKRLLKKKRNEDTSEEDQSIEQLSRKMHVRYTPYFYESLLKQKRDGSWKIDRKKYNELMEKIQKDRI